MGWKETTASLCRESMVNYLKENKDKSVKVAGILMRSVGFGERQLGRVAKVPFLDPRFTFGAREP